MSQLSNAKQPQAPALDQPRKLREKSEGDRSNKDYNKHWLIQEAEQRRISEAKQRQNQPESNMEKLENINNNVTGEKSRAQNNVSDNIYANVDVGQMNINTNYR